MIDGGLFRALKQQQQLGLYLEELVMGTYECVGYIHGKRVVFSFVVSFVTLLFAFFLGNTYKRVHT